MNITATYSPEDNKLRLYASSRLDEETYARVKEAGFRWAPKQELFVAPKWTTRREDLAIELAGEIEAEEMTMAERAQAKAERLEASGRQTRRRSKRIRRNPIVYDNWQRDIAWFSILHKEWRLCRTALEEWFLPENFDDDGQQKTSSRPPAHNRISVGYMPCPRRTFVC